VQRQEYVNVGTSIGSSKLKVEGHNYISLGGRVVLINSVLNSIPIFFLSFLKMPIAVWKKVVRIQRVSLGWYGRR